MKLNGKEGFGVLVWLVMVNNQHFNVLVAYMNLDHSKTESVFPHGKGIIFIIIIIYLWLGQPWLQTNNSEFFECGSHLFSVKFKLC